MSDQLFTCPLEWELQWGPDEDGDVSYFAPTPFGAIRIETSDGRWKWRYCFDEYYDEDESECESYEEGKKLAQEFWDLRIQGILQRRRPIE